MRSVVHVPRIKEDTVMGLSAFCEKASMVRYMGDHSDICYIHNTL